MSGVATSWPLHPSPRPRHPRWAWRWHSAHASRAQPGEPAQSRSELGASRAHAAEMPGFETFFAQYEGRISGYLWRMTGDEQSARDLSQETFLSAWQHFAQISSYDRPDAWLFRVATNFALQHLRQRSSAIRAATPIDEDSAASSDHGRRFAESDLVRQILLGLAPRQRSALILREVVGLSCDEVGRALGVSRDAAKMLLFRAREQFRERYLREDGEDR